MPDFHQALQLRERGFSVFPLRERSKKPAMDWKRFTKQHCTVGELAHWWGATRQTHYNIGIACGRISGIVAIDVDSKEEGRALYRKLPKTDMTTVTPNGVHFFYQISNEEVRPSVKSIVLGVAADIRGEDSYIVAPGSIHPSGQPYQQLGNWNLVDVPLFDPTWLEHSPTRPSTTPRNVRSGMAYITHIRAKSGEQGHKATFRAACALRDSGMTEAEALAALIDWNDTNAEPPWTVPELLHKVRDAYAKGTTSCSP